MRKVLSFAILAVAFLAITGTAQATDFASTKWTLTDTVDPSFSAGYMNTNGTNDPYVFTHDFTDQGFMPGYYTVTSVTGTGFNGWTVADINIDLSDDGSDGGGADETLNIYLDGNLVSSQNESNFSLNYITNNNLATWIQDNGKVQVTLDPTLGDLRFNESTLRAEGTRTIVPVDLELALLVDTSGSINATEFGIQKQGYVNAFQNLTTAQIDSAGSLGKIAVSLTYWSGNGQQSQAVDWYLIDTEADADAFAALISATGNQPFSGQTSISDALDFIDDDIITNGFDGARLVVDVSSDGQNNSPNSTVSTLTNARNAALAKLLLGANSYAINGLVFTSQFADLSTYFTNNVIGGTGVAGTDYFVLSVDDIADFGSAIQTKIIREIGPGPEPGIPEPSSMALLGLGLLSGLARLRRKRA